MQNILKSDLAKAFCVPRTVNEMEQFLTDLCTPAELRALSERWHIAQLLDQGQLSYREIQAQTGVSTTTIARVARFLKDEPYGGYRTLIETMKQNHD